YVVPTGRVIATVSIKVPTGRYIVPAGYIISPGLKDLSRAETYITYKAVRNGSIKKVEKRGNVGEPSKDKNARDDNKRTRTGNAFASTANPVGRENMGTWPKIVEAYRGM
ncbi:hypothetical protein Tco_0057006, partial [Tanacetum coccineum]